MTIEAELFDGTVLEFPDGTSPEVIKRVAKEQTAARQAPPSDKGARVGSGALSAPAEPSTGYDVMRSLGTGVRQGIEGLAGMAGDINDMNSRIVGWGAEKLGASPETASAMGEGFKWLNPATAFTAMAPTTSEIQKDITKPVVGEHYQPQTTAGEYARTVGEFAPNAMMGPGGAARKTAMAVVPPIASEAAGQATEGTAAEPYARMGGALVGGGLVAGRPTVTNAVKAPSAAEIKRSGGAMYDLADMTNVPIKQGAIQKIAGNVDIKLRKFAHDADLQPDTAIVVKRLTEATKKNDLSLAELENLRKKASDVARSAQRDSDRSAAGIIVEQIDNAMDDAASLVGNRENIGMLKEARQLWKRGRKAELLEEAVEKAQNQATGFENGLVVQFRSIANNPKKMRMFDKKEQDMIKSVVRRTSAHGVLRGIGMAAPNSTFGGLAGMGVAGASGILPAVAGAAVGAGSKSLAGRLTRQKVGQLQSAVANGRAPDPAQLNIEALARMLLSGEAAAQPQ